MSNLEAVFLIHLQHVKDSYPVDEQESLYMAEAATAAYLGWDCADSVGGADFSDPAGCLQ